MLHRFPRTILETLEAQEFCHALSLAARPTEVGTDTDTVIVRVTVKRGTPKEGRR